MAELTEPHSTGSPSVQETRRTSLRDRVLRSSAWVAGGEVASLAIRLGSTLILTRLLAPEAFGLVALAAVTQAVVTLLADAGIRQAVVQSPHGDTPRMLNTAWVMQIGRGAVIYGICLLIAGGLLGARVMGWLPAGTVYASPDLPAVLAVAALSALIGGFESTKTMLAERAVQMHPVIRIEVLSNAAGIAIGVGAALVTGSFWALVAGSVATTAIMVVLSHLWVPGPRNRWEFDRPLAREIFRFGRWVMASSTVYTLGANGDRLLLGALATPHVLGLYAIAASLAAVVQGIAGRIGASVVTATLSETARDDRERFRATFLKLRLRFDLFFLFVSGVGFACADLAVRLLYDPRYDDAGWMLQVLFLGLAFTRYGVCSNAFLALGQPQLLFRFTVVKTVSLYLSFLIGYQVDGMTGAIWGIALHELATVPFLLAKCRSLGLLSWRHELVVLPAWPVGYGIGHVVALWLGPWIK